MTVHVAIFKWKEGVATEDIQRLMADIRALKKSIPQIVEIYAGENFSKWAKEYTHAVVVTLKSREDLDAYRVHPAHKPIADLCNAYEADSIGFDFES
ncbi:MAG TPA: Dabb family protein [Candidatus Paceibacterota bacterium]